MKPSDVAFMVEKIVAQTGDRHSVRNWRGLCEHLSQAEVERALEYLRSRDGVKNPGAYLNTILRGLLCGKPSTS